MSILFLQRRAVLYALIFMLAMPSATWVAAATEVRTVVTTGESEISGNDPVEARKRAIDRACFAAVEQVLDELLAQEAVDAPPEMVAQLVLAHSAAFIQNYKVHTQGQDGDLYRVQIECAVGVDALKARLAAAGITGGLVAKGGRSVLFLIAERNFPRDPPQYWWGPDYLFARAASETALEKILTESGFSVIDHDARRREVPLDLAAGLGAEPSVEETLRMGAFFEADIAIVGLAVAEKVELPTQGGPAKFQGRVRVRAFEVHSGRLIADVQEQAVAAAANEITGSQSAIGAAGRQAGRALVQGLGAAEKQTSDRIRTLTLSVKGIRPLAHLIRFRQALGALPGIESVQTREMTATQAMLQVRLFSSISKLSDDLRRQTFDSFRVQVLDVGADRITVELVGS